MIHKRNSQNSTSAASSASVPLSACNSVNTLGNAMRLSDLVKLIAVIAICTTNWSCSSKEASVLQTVTDQSIRGAGATFPAPLYKKWVEEYRHVQPDVVLSYEVVGSGEGTTRFLHELVDFGASDAALTDAEIAQVDRGAQLIPATAGSIVLAYNVPGVEVELKLSREVYVDIFLGKITKWRDERLKRDNPGIEFPDLTISVTARLDSSGTTFAFANHLSAISDEWRDRGPGTGRVIDWPGSAMLARGNEGVAGNIKRYPGTIGYVEYGVASRAGLELAWLENKAGNFIEPTGTSGIATLTNADMPDNLRAFFPDPSGDDAYPIVTFSWLLLYKQYPDVKRGEQLKAFVHWCLQQGQKYSEPLGYIPLAPEVASRAIKALDEIH